MIPDQVRNLRTLCDSKGKSVGILLLEYSDAQSVRRATEADSICRIRLLQGFGIVPRAMLVSCLIAAIPKSPLCSKVVMQTVRFQHANFTQPTQLIC